MVYAALDIGGTKTIAALVDEKGAVLRQEKFATDVRDCGVHLEKCADSLRHMLSEEGAAAASVPGIGVSLPGIVDNDGGILLNAPYAGWHDVPVAGILNGLLGIPRVRCENDVNACALAELRFGAGSRYSDFVWMTVSTGVGGACVADGRLIRGAQGFAGELGHLKVEYEAPATCPCGQKGCLEAHGSGTALRREIETAVREDTGFANAFAERSYPINAESCALLAAEGNGAAKRIFARIGKYLGRGMAYCINVLNPRAIIVGGGVAASLELMLESIREEIASDAHTALRNVDVLATPLGYEAALLGAASLVIDGR